MWWFPTYSVWTECHPLQITTHTPHSKRKFQLLRIVWNIRIFSIISTELYNGSKYIKQNIFNLLLFTYSVSSVYKLIDWLYPILSACQFLSVRQPVCRWICLILASALVLSCPLERAVRLIWCSHVPRLLKIFLINFAADSKLQIFLNAVKQLKKLAV